MRLQIVILILFMWKIRVVLNQFCAILKKMKKIENIVESKWQSEGRGARVRRSIGRPELRNLDPFLMLDEFSGNAKNGAGFPDHPHRGFETVSYLLEVSYLYFDITLMLNSVVFSPEIFFGNTSVRPIPNIRPKSAEYSVPKSIRPR